MRLVVPTSANLIKTAALMNIARKIISATYTKTAQQKEKAKTTTNFA